MESDVSLAPTKEALSDVATTVFAARLAFGSGRTRTVAWRRATLERLRTLIIERESRLTTALASDLAKPPFEAWAMEIGFALSEIEHTLTHLNSWTQPEKVPTPVMFQPGRSRITPEPLGVVCIIAPWNFPIQLVLLPMIAALAAGNAVVVKPSELAPACTLELVALLEALHDTAVGVVTGGVAETTELLTHRFDHIFYTGNSRVARIVMRAAAEYLTPVTLELGGKSPAIVSQKANISVAARRIVWGKFINAGQTCIAPDYVLVERAAHDELVTALIASIREFYGANPKSCVDYGRIVSDSHFRRLAQLLQAGTTAIGGEYDAESRYIAPTVLTDVSIDDAVMREEIFGPILPVIAVDSLDEAVAFVNVGEKPLALYCFSEADEETDRITAGTSSGGVCVNGTLLQMSNGFLPFGGVGESGMGSYHGKFGFDTFSHRKAVHTRTTRLDPPLLYPPYSASKEKLVRRAVALGDPRELVGRVKAHRARRGKETI
jgi:aldehyde dehydrogenase (NAD+)